MRYEVAVEDTTIPVSDGIELAARVWRPRSAGPVPAVLEYIPYRKGDLTSVRDGINHPYLAGHGYACVRVDIRGSGDSGGVLTDEYLELEQRDAEDVLAWLAARPWCDGQTAMMGISWGAFAALQVAARKPPSLRALCIASFTDDRYADDMHYMGGCLLSDNLAESGTMFAYSTCPPDPAGVGERWRDMWFERLAAAGPWAAHWLSHQRRDDYWRHASVCEDYSAIQVPVFAASGWADGYSNAVLRLMARLDVPRRGLIGPWSHKYPHLGQPGPAVGYLQEVVRWLDRWLLGRENGVDTEPVLQTWMQDSVPPSTSYQERPGRWVAEPAWPSPQVETVAWPMAPYRLGVGEDAAISVSSPLSLGQFAGKWCSYNAPPDLPYDQREEDGGALVFETPPLPERCEILGAPVVRLAVSADRPVAMVAARLSDVAPDGAATRVSYGLLNLSHRDGHDDPAPVEPGEVYHVEVPLNGVAQTFPAGHRIRLSLSSSYWPLAWPPPTAATVTVHTGDSSLLLPVRTDGGTAPALLEPPDGAEPPETEQLTPPAYHWRVSRDLTDYRSSLDVLKDNGFLRFADSGMEVGKHVQERYCWTANDFTSAAGETDWTMTFRRGDWVARVQTRQKLTCTETEFVLHAHLDAYEGDDRVYSRDWRHSFPRDHL
ncbi:CocE/NonD family hydrolase [Actinokineospora fastidiosa]|uniref:Peptidase S15 n=1 Tax=Actinokineospora fastidiosa TaxID=1816 RepID=A0A918LCU1_9PSEU|nr:CocE/NonD family hydrolase [Actinokineospora fastidiosa]GGS30926.1 peptidase S15 [Actinokineospora fastidiosa]